MKKKIKSIEKYAMEINFEKLKLLTSEIIWKYKICYNCIKLKISMLKTKHTVKLGSIAIRQLNIEVLHLGYVV